MHDLATQFALSSDAVQLAIVGGLFWLFAGLCALMEWRRGRNRSVERLEKVGWVPWTALFLSCAMIGGGLLAMSLPVVLGGL
ncbi:MAG: hypothetical protein SXU28_05690 [Pseudomonadota bacterium]|nr:hypothetical protein [Pseudomonadota bacterium]